MERCEIIKIYAERKEKIEDLVSQEIPFTIYVNGKELLTLLSSPEDLEELTVGFLFTAGIIKQFKDIRTLIIDTKLWRAEVKLKQKVEFDLVFKRMFTSGCGGGTLFYNPVDIMHRRKTRSKIKIKRDSIFRIMKDFQNCSIGFKQTGGVHQAALCDRKRILLVKEDIGRHNAIDKILGFALMNNMDLKDKIILSSGRVSSEVLLKIQKTEIGLVVSRSAPTNQAIKHATEANITLIGFARGKKMNVYSNPERII